MVYFEDYRAIKHHPDVKKMIFDGFIFLILPVSEPRNGSIIVDIHDFSSMLSHNQNSAGGQGAVASAQKRSVSTGANSSTRS